jgi:thiol-disulfide isomerase/thioredoxin
MSRKFCRQRPVACRSQAPVGLPRPCSDFLIRSTLGLLNRPQMKSVAFLLLCITSVAFADDFKTTRGKEYKNVSVSRIEPDGIVLKTKSGISKIYFVELPKDVQKRFHYNPANAAAYSTAQAFAKPGLAGRGQPVEIISHGTQVDINQHLALGYVTVVDFYADWCPACKWLSPRLEQMAASDPQIALRKIDIVNWKTAVARQFTIDSLPQVNIYNRAGQLIGTVSGADIDQIKSYIIQAKARG